jgi:REP element-mobilizing transposase RayT
MSRDPLAFFITYTCYGTWLHGEEAGSVQRGQDRDRSLLAPNPTLRSFEERELAQPPYSLDEPRRQVVLRTILEVARHRRWVILAAHARTNHVHVVVSGTDTPEKMMNDFKSYASRRLNEAGFDTPARSRWTRHGSTRYLWDEEVVLEKIHYVAHEQGEPMAVYVAPEHVSQARE